MITCDLEKCTRCGQCAKVCHESCITVTEEGPHFEAGPCSTCTQCVAVCPSRALTWDGVAPLAFDRQRLPAPEQLDELFRERRSIRFFKREPVDRELLAEMVQYGLFAPTHAFALRAIVVDDPALIGVLDQAIVNTCRWLYRLGYQFKAVGWLAACLGFEAELVRARPKIEATLRQGHAFHSLPTAFIFIVGDRRTPLSEASAQYALANMMYYAQVCGVGTCLWANGPLFIDKHAGARRRLGLKPGERIFGAMYLGYPAVSFSNKVAGKVLPVQWNGAGAR